MQAATATEGPGAPWKHLSAALTDMQDLLRCWSCNKVFEEPVSYRCGHFFCAQCAKIAGTKCGFCQVPSLASEIRPDRMVNSVVGCFQTLSNIVNHERRDSEGGGSGDIDASSTNVNDSCHLNNKKPCAKSESDTILNQVENMQLSSKLKSDKDAFVKPTRVRKSSSKEISKLAATARNKEDNSNLNQSTEENSTLYSEKKPKEVKTTLKKSGDVDIRLASDSAPLDSNKKSVCSDEEFPPDSFATPKKPRRSGKTSSDISSNSKSKEINLSMVRSTPRKSNTPLVKKNHKGETPLHVACIKGNVPRVRSLLEANASPNTKDNAGWTPLHEAVNHGFTEVVELLLKAGAFLDVPGAGNVTPLHEAVANNHIAIVKLLVAHGADVYARSSKGETPMDLATSDELREALLTSKKEVGSKDDAAAVKTSKVPEEMVLCGESRLTDEDKMQLFTIAVALDVRVVPAFGPDVTHLVVPSDSNGSCPPSMELLCALLKGVFILNRDWLEWHAKGQTGTDEETFELAGVAEFIDADAPKLSRLNAQKQLPGLFNGCHFFVTGNAHYKLPGCCLSRPDILTLIKTGGGIVLTRQPDPEAIPKSEQTVPYHAPRNGQLTSTSHFIVYSPGKGEPEMKYNMKHCKTLTVEWFVNCVLNWQLIDP